MGRMCYLYTCEGAGCGAHDDREPDVVVGELGASVGEECVVEVDVALVDGGRDVAVHLPVILIRRQPPPAQEEVPARQIQRM